MPRHVPLPPRLDHFAVGEGAAFGLGAKRMRGRDLARPFHGARSVGEVDLTSPTTRACAAFAPLLGPEQHFSHTTAALLWGAPLPREHDAALPLHVTSVGTSYAAARRNVVGHRSSAGRDVVVSRRHGFPVADPVMVFLQLASILALDDLVAVGDHLVLDPAVLDPHDIRPYVTIDELRAGVAGFHGRGCRAAASAMLLVRAGAESRPETLLRLLLAGAGLPEPELNPELYSDNGRWLGRADIVFRRWKVIVEYDGDQHRTDVRQYEHDIHRIERFEREGWIVVRVRSRGLRVGRVETVARVTRALMSRGWTR